MQSDYVFMYRSILIAVDGSDSNKIAVDDGLELAKAVGAGVTAISVFDIGSYTSVSQGYGINDERAVMMEVSREALVYIEGRAEALGVPLVTKTAIGHPADAIIEETKFHDLVVCGTLGRSGITRVLIGSVAEKVTRLAHCPVLVCRKR